MKFLLFILAVSGAPVFGAGETEGMNEILMDGCAPQAFAGIWTHMMHDREVPGGGLRQVIVTCPKAGDSCQVVDINKQSPPDDTVSGGCGFVGTLTPKDMFVDETTGMCAFKPLELGAAGCAYNEDFPNLSMAGRKDHDDLWYLSFETAGELHTDRWTTRNSCSAKDLSSTSALAMSRSENVDASQWCIPELFEGVWTHAMQDVGGAPGGGLRQVMVTCPRYEQSGRWGDGSCQIADANEQMSPDGTEGGCGFVGTLTTKDMYISDTGNCAFNYVDLAPAGCDLEGLSVSGEQDSDVLWLLMYSFDGGETKMGPRHTTRAACNSQAQVASAANQVGNAVLAESTSSAIFPSSYLAIALACLSVMMV